MRLRSCENHINTDVLVIGGGMAGLFTAIRAKEQGKMKVYREPIPEKWWPDLSKPYEERYPKIFPGE